MIESNENELQNLVDKINHETDPFAAELDLEKRYQEIANIDLDWVGIFSDARTVIRSSLGDVLHGDIDAIVEDSPIDFAVQQVLMHAVAEAHAAGIRATARHLNASSEEFTEIIRDSVNGQLRRRTDPFEFNKYELRSIEIGEIDPMND